MSAINTIRFFNETIRYNLKQKRKRIDWLVRCIKSEKKIPASINFIFCNDAFLLEMNKKYLNHDFYTDIIAFAANATEKEVAGDIYISIDRIKDNAKQYRVRIDDELDRVMIHGILHLTGYQDKELKDKKLMTILENKYLALR